MSTYLVDYLHQQILLLSEYITGNVLTWTIFLTWEFDAHCILIYFFVFSQIATPALHQAQVPCFTDWTALRATFILRQFSSLSMRAHDVGYYAGMCSSSLPFCQARRCYYDMIRKYPGVSIYCWRNLCPRMLYTLHRPDNSTAERCRLFYRGIVWRMLILHEAVG